MEHQFVNNATECEVRNSINKKKKRKGGRPKISIDERRLFTTRPGFNESEFERLEARAESVGLDLPEFIRRLALNQPFYAMPAVNRAGLVELSRIGNNINQIARVLKSNPNPIGLIQHLSNIETALEKIGLQLTDTSAENES